MPLVLWIVKGQFHTPDCFPTLAAGTLPECAVPDVVGKVVQLVVGMVQDVVEVVGGSRAIRAGAMGGVVRGAMRGAMRGR